MNEFREPHLNYDQGRDPLERLVEAFVELSVPDGPDAAVQRRLAATLAGVASCNTVAALAPATISQRNGAARWWVGALARQSMALAAGILVLVAAALLVTSRRQGAPGPAAPGSGDLVGAPTPNEDVARNDATDILDPYLRSDGSKRDFVAVLSVVLKERQELSKSPRWQKAQAQLSYALEKPEVIGLGVGLLGTLPLASYGRF
jgi:hypothetical protein